MTRDNAIPATGPTLLERAAARFALHPGGAIAAPATVVPFPRAERAPRARVTIDRDRLESLGMLVPGGPVTMLAEEFRLIKRQVLLTAQRVEAAGGRAARSVLVCSAQPNDGKTFSAINLALSLSAERDTEIVLVDADFAKQDVANTLGFVANGPGLLDAMADPAIDVEACILDTDVPNLSVLPAGAPTNSDTELLASAAGRAVIQRLMTADPRRIVIFDSPPALAASPAPFLAGLVAQTLIVVRADVTSEGDLRQAVQLLDGCAQVQLMLNSIAYRPGGARYGDYYAYGREGSQ